MGAVHRSLIRPVRAGPQLAAASSAPLVITLGMAFFVPLVILAAYSVWQTQFFVVVHDWTLGNYREGVATPLYRDLIVRTIVVSLVTSITATTLAIAFAYAATFHLRRIQTTLLFAVLVSMFASYLVRVYAFQTLLGQRGVVNWLLQSLHITHHPLDIFLFNRFAVGLTLINVLLPFAILPIWSAMQNIDRSVVDAARDLGETSAGAFRAAILPGARTGILAAATITFVFAAGDYVTPNLVGGTNGTMIGRVIADQFGLSANWPLGAALAFLTMVGLVLGIAVLKVLDLALALATTLPSLQMKTYSNRSRERPTVWPIPFVLGVAGFLYIPLTLVVLLSFTTAQVPALPIHGLTLDWYQRLWHDPVFRTAARTSLGVAVAVSGLSLLLAAPFAFAVSRSRRHTQLGALALVTIPLAMPGLVTGIALLTSSVLIGVTLGRATIVAGQLVVILPVVVLTLLARFRGLDPALEEAGRDLGEPILGVARRVILPQVWPALAGGALVAAALSIDEFLVTNLVSGTQMTVPLFIWSKLRTGVTPDTNAISTIVLLTIIVLAVAGTLFTRVSATSGSTQRRFRGVRPSVDRREVG